MTIDVAEKAKEIVDLAETAPDLVSDELRKMPEDERKAIAAQIKENQKQNQNDELPVLEFYDSGNLKIVSDKDPATPDPDLPEIIYKEMTQKYGYDEKSGNRVIRVVDTVDGEHGTTLYDAATGEFKSEEATQKDGSKMVVENRGDGRSAATSYDPQGRIVGTSEELDPDLSNKYERQFGYDDQGNLNRIEGRLGHWEKRTGDDGKSYWQNTDKNLVWHGDFKIDHEGNLHYDSHKGKDYEFTRDGIEIDR